MQMEVDTLAASLRRLKSAARGLSIADIARQAVDQIETAAAADRHLATKASVAVTLRTAVSAGFTRPLPGSRLTITDGRVTLAWTYAGVSDEVFVGWPDLRVEVRDNLAHAHALEALADALAAILLGRAEALAGQPGGGSPDA